MIASLAPVLRTTAKADALEDNALKGATSSSEYQFNFSFSKPIISEVGSDKYISRTITITNIGQAVTNSSNDDGKRIKIHIFNTNDSTFTSDFPSADRLPEKGGGKDGNVNYYPYAVSKSNNDATIEFSDSSHDIYIKNPTRTDASGEYIFFDENETITIEVRHKYKKGDENKTLVNFIALYIPQKNKGDTFDYGHEIGSTSEGTVDNVVNSTPPPTGTLTVTSKLADGSTENPGTITYTVTGTGIESTGSYGDGVTPADGSLTFTLSPTDSTGVSKELTLPEGSYTVSQSEVTGWTTASEASNGSVSGGITVSASDAATATFTLTKTPTTPAGTKVTYHLNLPQDASFIGDKAGKDYVYYQGEGDILELWEIDSFINKDDADDKIEKVDITQNKAATDDFSSYANGYLNKATNLSQRYYFVGWSTSDTAFEANTNDYSDIKYPAVYLSGHTTGKTGEDIGLNGYGVRGIYGYPSDFVYSPTCSKALTDKFSNAGDKDLYAIWVLSNTNAGLMGYTMQIVGGDFPGARDNHTVGNMYTGESSTGQKLGINGMGGEGKWYKYTVLDQGYKQGDEFAVATDEPQYYGTSEDYVKGEQRVTNFVTWKLKNAGKTKDGVEDKNQYIANPGDTVKYFGNYNVYSLDAVWATVTAPDKQIKGYNGNPQYPNMEQLKTAFNGADSNQDIFKTLFATDNRFASDSPATNAYLTYSFEITKDGTRVESTGTSGDIPGVTEPGVYKYTIKAHYKVDSTAEPVTGKTVGRAVDKDIGTVSFLFIIQPRLTLNVTKSLTGRAWKSDDSFTFTVSVDGTGAAVTDGNITIADDTADKKGTAYVNFSNVTTTQTFTITVAETKPSASEPGMTYAADQTVKITATADANGFITLEDASGTTSATVGTDGNATAAVTMTNAYNTGSLTVKKEVAPSTTSKGAGPFTITVTFDGWTPPASLKDSDTHITNVDGNTVTLSLKKGETVTINDIPVGVTYTVSETDPSDGSTSDITSGGSGTIKAGSNEVTVTNTYPAPTGKLTITKTVEGTNAPSEWSFEFTVKANDGTSLNGSYGTGVEKNSDGTLKVTLKNGAASVTIENLPIGTYTVTETKADGYELTAATGDNVTRTSGENAFTAAITEDGTTTAAVTNTFLTGDLKITKTVTGTNAPSEWSFEFTVKATDGTIPDGSYGTDVLYNPSDGTLTVTVNQGNTDGVTVTNLPIGTYTVEENTAGLTNYGTPTYDLPAAPSTGVTVTKDGTATVTVTNHYDQPTGSLTITKTVEGVASASGQEFTFTVTAPSDKTVAGTSFTVTGATAGTITFSGRTATVTVKMDADLTKTVTIEGLPTGYYKVEENTADLSDYNTTYAPDDAPSTGVNVTESGGEVTVTNTHKTGDLTINKTVTGSGPAVPTNGTFTFTVQATGDTVAKVAGETYGDVTFDKDGKSGNVTFTVTGTSGTKTITGLPIGTYTVTETVPAGYQVDGDNPKSVTLTTSGATAAFSNTFLTGNLTINKTVTGTNAPDNGTFTFTVKATGDTATKVAGKEFGSISFSADGTLNSTVEITVSRGTGSDITGTMTITGLPIGTYTVEENTAGLTNYGTPTYDLPAAPSTGVTVTKDGTATVTVTNHYDQPTGSLTITKTVEGVASASGQEFTFTVTAPSDKTVAGTSFTVTGATAGTITFSGRTATVTVKMDADLTKTVTIEGLPTGEYTVVEDAASSANYNTTYSNNANTTGVNVTESGAEVTVTNTHKTGTLTISKTVTGSGPAVPTNGTFTFTITAPDGLIAAGTSFNLEGAAGTVTFTDGKTATVTITTASKEGSVTITGLPVGDYKVKETVPTGYASTDGEKTATVNDTGTPASVSFTNTYQTGTLQITKTVDGIASASGKEFTFTITAPADKIADGTKFTVTGASDITFNGDKAEVTIVMDTAISKTVTIANLPAGSYTVEETGKTADYTVDGAASKTVTITGGSTDNVTITNKHDTGDLTITKNVTGGTNVKVSQTFTFTVQAQDNLIKEGASFDVSNGTSAKFNGGVAEVTVTLSNSDTGSVTIEGLPVGQYTITEKDVPTGYTASGPETVTVAKGTTPVTVTNTVQTTSLTIGKTVVYPTDFPADKKLDANVVEYTFTVAFKDFPAGVTSFDLNVGGTSKTVTTADNIVTFKLKAGVQTELKNIPIGIGYEVTEAFQSDDLGRHFTTEWLNRTGTLNSSTTVTCTNTYHMLEVGNGALVIRKEAIGGQAGTVYQFKVTFTQGGSPYTGQIGGKTLGSDGSATFEMDDTINHVLVIQVPVGVAYTVEEVFASGERPKEISVRLEQNEAGDSTSGETASGTISQEFNYHSVIFTNRYLGDLTISKTVSGVYGGEVFTFTVTLPTGTYTYTGDKSGAISSGGTVTLKDGESITIQNLPAGSSYTVTEAGTANYTSSSVGATGTIANNTTAAAAFTNNRNTGSLTVTKTLTGKLAASSDTFTFTVTLTGVGTGFNGTLGDVTFTNGVGTITIEGAGSRTISGLPVGAGFTVKEQDAAGYVTTYNNDPANHTMAEGTISANPTTVTVNNDKPDTGTITITKVVENAPAGSDEEFKFTITLYLDEGLTNVATDVNGEHSGFNFINGVASFTLKNGDSVIGEGEVTVSEGRLFYKIEETADSDYTTTSTTSDANGNSGGSVVTGEFTQDSQNTTVTFTNTYNYGDLTITKKVTDDSGASHANDKFTFTITKKGESTPTQTVEITGAGSKTVTLPAGEYIVTETAGMGDSVAYRVGTSGSSAANAEVTITAGGSVTVTVTNTYYSGGGTGGTGGGGGTPSPDIDTSEHYGYIIGVTHTEVAPEQNITRAEIATILFRLLTDEARAANWSENSGFPDVKSGVWYNHAVAVLHKMGIILGDDNGNFNPDQNITRAEVAAMVVRFYEVAEGTVLNNRFTDVETTKWYAEAVLLADYYGLMQGDGDTFKPEDLLTRAEAMTVFNRLLGRKPHKDHLHKDMITWTDNTDKNKWYYAEVQEATNSHTCGNNVVIDGKIYETWSAITKMRDWAALEY